MLGKKMCDGPLKSASTSKIIPGLYTVHRPTECNHKLKGKPIHRKQEEAKEDKTIVKIVTNDSIREMIIPNKNPHDRPEIWPTNELERLKQQSHVMTMKDRIAVLDAANERKRQLINECEMRKENLRRAQKRQEKGKRLNDIELAEYNRASYLLKRALELQRENEMEVQEANRLILATKCQAIRDAQLIEKQLIQNELKEEEKRLQEMQEQKNARAYEKELKRREEEKANRKAFVKGILQQVTEHEMSQLFEMERKEEDARMQNKMLLQMQREADEKRQKKLEENRKCLEEAKLVNEELIKFQLIRKEEERIEDLRIKEFLRKKAEREAAVIEEQRLIQEAKNREKDRLFELQVRALTLQSTGDEMNAKRIQEEVERKWRAAEIETAKKRVENNERLKKDRENQIMDLKRMQALDMERDKSEFYKNITVQKKLYEKEVEEKKKRREANMKYRADLLRQMNEKETYKIAEKKHVYEDGVAFKLQQDTKAQEIKSYIKEKVTKLKEVNFVPEHLVKDIERQLKI